MSGDRKTLHNVAAPDFAGVVEAEEVMAKTDAEIYADANRRRQQREIERRDEMLRILRSRRPNRNQPPSAGSIPADQPKPRPLVPGTIAEE
jgi:hypothetical protein